MKSMHGGARAGAGWKKACQKPPPEGQSRIFNPPVPRKKPPTKLLKRLDWRDKCKRNATSKKKETEFVKNKCVKNKDRPGSGLRKKERGGRSRGFRSFRTKLKASFQEREAEEVAGYGPYDGDECEQSDDEYDAESVTAFFFSLAIEE